MEGKRRSLVMRRRRLDRATRKATAFEDWAEFERALAEGYVPALDEQDDDEALLSYAKRVLIRELARLGYVRAADLNHAPPCELRLRRRRASHLRLVDLTPGHLRAQPSSDASPGVKKHRPQPSLEARASTVDSQVAGDGPCVVERRLTQASRWGEQLRQYPAADEETEG